MIRILLTGTVLLTLIGSAAHGAQKHAIRHQQAAVQEQAFGSGARVDGIEPNSAAEHAGMRPGDLIVGVNGYPINSYADVDMLVAGSRGRPLTVYIKRGGSLARLRATPRHGVLGFSQTVLGFGRGGSDETYIPPPPIPPTPPYIEIPAPAN